MSGRTPVALSLVTALLFAACGAADGAGTSTSASTPVVGTATTGTAATTTIVGEAPTEAARLGITEAEAATLLSLVQIADHPLYTMTHYADDPPVEYGAGPPRDAAGTGDSWACSLFAALADPDGGLFGRNFDWDHSPAVLLFNDPPGGLASVSMVDIAYLGFPGATARGLADRPIDDLLGLLDATLLPFDGMNEAGLAIGMAAVPRGGAPFDPDEPTVDSVGIIRVILDRATTVEEAVGLMEDHNVDFTDQQGLHYLIADAAGDAALVEFNGGAMLVVRSPDPWHQATNFLRTSVADSDGQCSRHDLITAELEAGGGSLDADEAMDLLSRVAQPSTQWSIVYDLDGGEIRIVMGRDYRRVHTFTLELGDG